MQVNGPVLSADDRKTIGTRKRYGVAADVIYGVGGVQGVSLRLDMFSLVPSLVQCYVVMVTLTIKYIHTEALNFS